MHTALAAIAAWYIGDDLQEDVERLQGAAAALPDGPAYKVFDPETDYDLLADPEDYDNTVMGSWDQGPQLASWSGPPSYGDLAQLSTPAGPGLVMSFGGSPLNSAFTVWLVPLAAIPPGTYLE